MNSPFSKISIRTTNIHTSSFPLVLFSFLKITESHSVMSSVLDPGVTGMSICLWDIIVEWKRNREVSITEDGPGEVWTDGVWKIERESGQEEQEGIPGRRMYKRGQSHEQVKSREMQQLISNMAARKQRCGNWWERPSLDHRMKENLGRPGKVEGKSWALGWEGSYILGFFTPKLQWQSLQ